MDVICVGCKIKICGTFSLNVLIYPTSAILNVGLEQTPAHYGWINRMVQSLQSFYRNCRAQQHWSICSREVSIQISMKKSSHSRVICCQGLQHIYVEGDAKKVIESIQGSILDLSYNATMLKDNFVFMYAGYILFC